MEYILYHINSHIPNSSYTGKNSSLVKMVRCVSNYNYFWKTIKIKIIVLRYVLYFLFYRVITYYFMFAKSYHKQQRKEGQRDEYIAYKLSFTHVLVTKYVFQKIVSFKNYPRLYPFLIRDLSLLCYIAAVFTLYCPTD